MHYSFLRIGGAPCRVVGAPFYFFASARQTARVRHWAEAMFMWSRMDRA